MSDFENPDGIVYADGEQEGILAPGWSIWLVVEGFTAYKVARHFEEKKQAEKYSAERQMLYAEHYPLLAPNLTFQIVAGDTDAHPMADRSGMELHAMELIYMNDSRLKIHANLFVIDIWADTGFFMDKREVKYSAARIPWPGFEHKIWQAITSYPPEMTLEDFARPRS